MMQDPRQVGKRCESKVINERANRRADERGRKLQKDHASRAHADNLRPRLRHSLVQDLIIPPIQPDLRKELSCRIGVNGKSRVMQHAWFGPSASIYPVIAAPAAIRARNDAARLTNELVLVAKLKSLDSALRNAGRAALSRVLYNRERIRELNSLWCTSCTKLPRLLSNFYRGTELSL